MALPSTAEASVAERGRGGEIGGGGGDAALVLAGQSADVLFQVREGRGLLRLETQRRGHDGLLPFVRLLSVWAQRVWLLLVQEGEEGALEGDGMQRAGVGVHFFGPTRHQVRAVARVQLGFRVHRGGGRRGGGVENRKEGGKKGVAHSGAEIREETETRCFKVTLGCNRQTFRNPVLIAVIQKAYVDEI